MRCFHLALAMIFLAAPAAAQQRDDILRCRALSDDGLRLACYDAISADAPFAPSPNRYEDVRLGDLKAEIQRYRRSPVAVTGYLQPEGNYLMLGEAPDDENPVVVDYRDLTRLQREDLMAHCAEGCIGTVRGRVTNVAFRSGIVADSIVHH